MIARSPEELELFNKMDQEMYERENKEARMEEIKKNRPGLRDYSQINWRLIQDWEVPEWVKPSSQDDEQESNSILTKRKRTEYKNPDTISDTQFFQELDAGLHPYEKRQSGAKRASA